MRLSVSVASSVAPDSYIVGSGRCHTRDPGRTTVTVVSVLTSHSTYFGGDVTVVGVFDLLECNEFW